MRPKVFGIGLNKTGTTTLQAALEILGYRVTALRCLTAADKGAGMSFR